ncbi:MAG TPA: hydroxymethylbilane synthase [Chloroflexota bacterium]|nr:hydroxymethylbilane synthase [Chloroflexota bacterium]
MSTITPEHAIKDSVSLFTSAECRAEHPLRLGTRGSVLALAQTAIVQTHLTHLTPPIASVVTVVHSLGDRVRDQPLASLESQGIFTEALEQALRESVVDAAIHSAKDLPSTLPSDMLIAAALGREDPRDCLVSAHGVDVLGLPQGATVGTGSPRRVSQLRRLRPDLRFEPLRGNVDTRRRAALEGRVDAVVLAVAGLNRLGLMDRHAAPIPIEQCLPQAGQGTLVIEIRADDIETASIFRPLDRAYRSTLACLDAERAVLACLRAGCQAPVAAHAEILPDQSLLLRGCVASLDGQVVVRFSHQGHPETAAEIGRIVANGLRDQGAEALLIAAANGAP